MYVCKYCGGYYAKTEAGRQADGSIYTMVHTYIMQTYIHTYTLHIREEELVESY